jgi:hypothetical protein
MLQYPKHLSKLKARTRTLLESAKLSQNYDLPKSKEGNPFRKQEAEKINYYKKSGHLSRTARLKNAIHKIRTLKGKV